MFVIIGAFPRLEDVQARADGAVKARDGARGELAQVRLEFAVVLLRHRFVRERRVVEAPQHGQRGKRLMIAAISLRRMVAIEFGMCRSGRKGGSPGSVTVGYDKLPEQRGGTRS